MKIKQPKIAQITLITNADHKNPLKTIKVLESTDPVDAALEALNMLGYTLQFETDED
jgi:hypothetical protein